MKIPILLALTLLSVQFSQASHLLGGYIQAKSVSGSPLTYDITATVYMQAGSAADQLTSLTMCIGNGTYTVVNRANQQYLSTDKSITASTYRFVYTYLNPGTYTINVHIDGRTQVKNIRNPNNLTLTLATTLTTYLPGLTNTPTVDFPSTNFRVGVNQKVIISLKATDADGDSLAYFLAKPLTRSSASDCTNQSIPSYLFPNDVTYQGTFKLNSRTGELVWDAPTQQGNYSVVLNLMEYRNGIPISQTIQEITLTVTDLPGTPSAIPAYEPAGEGGVITGTTNYTDSDVTLTTFPNPVDDWLQVIIQTSSPGTAAIRLMDVNGRKLHELTFGKASRKHEQIISMDSLPPGIYLLHADVGGRSLVRKVVKK
ncbi:T9SS type A sorting domain-containing protein [Spirosoma validum]|uniref:T9SS type A sorting domain-containing protein n=1 Tax=Spirosoma validum TaxID=2771355 RepID=A0A927AX65_9BACT|nr:T9SS type A sorting domain-containing protein [Spirosoma validum]MBD2751474.1 T9SS type A sorting domain-containing protein [Spirosoma validum]